MSAKDFVEAFEAAAAKRWRGPVSPTQIVACYEQFVESVEEGYDWNIYEYDNDMYVRDLLAHLLEDASIRVHPEFGWVIKAADALDRRLRKVLTAKPVRGPDLEGRWWWSRLPVIAGPDLADDLESLYDYKFVRTD